MSSIKVERNTPTCVQRSRLHAYKEALDNFLKIVTSCRMPESKLKILQNTSGGSLTLTSSSKRLFSSLSVRKPVIQLLVTSAQGHLNAYNDGGLFVAALAADLVLRSMECTKMDSKLLAEIYETLLTVCLDYLNSPNCAFKWQMKMSDLNSMKSFVRNIVGTKPLCELNDSKLEHITKTVLETFLQCLSDGNQKWHSCEYVYTVTNAGYDVLNSKSFPGLLLPAPELSKFKVQTLKAKHVKRNRKTCVLVALVTVSLSGDLYEFSGVSYEVNQGLDIDNIALEKLTDFCNLIIQAEVGLVLCQKVVHPELKLLLQSSGVIVVDRVGLQPVKFIAKLTDCVPIQSLDSRVSESSFGYLDSVQHEIIDKKSYIHLTRADNSVTTLMLYHNHEKPLMELKDVCETSLDALQQLLYQPTVLAGGGCWQAGLAQYLLAKVEADAAILSDELECTESIVREASTIFAQALTTVALGSNHRYRLSRKNGHVFNIECYYSNHLDVAKQCCCGYSKIVDDEELVNFDSLDVNNLKNSKDFLMEPTCLGEDISSRNIVFDSSAMCLSALQTSVLTACSILKIGQVIENL